jgi:hypothetical protein
MRNDMEQQIEIQNRIQSMMEISSLESVVKFYARFDFSQDSKKTPKYTMSLQAGDCPEMQDLRGRDEKISMYLMQSRDSGCTKDNAPEMRLQAKDAFNFTGLKFINEGQIPRYAYGNPLPTKTYSSREKPNPMYNYRDDGYLFEFHYKENAGTTQLQPDYFELLIIRGGKTMIPNYCKQLSMGYFDDVLKSMRKQADNLKFLYNKMELVSKFGNDVRQSKYVSTKNV